MGKEAIAQDLPALLAELLCLQGAALPSVAEGWNQASGWKTQCWNSHFDLNCKISLRSSKILQQVFKHLSIKFYRIGNTAMQKNT